jgi:hypothetical protein
MKADVDDASSFRQLHVDQERADGKIAMIVLADRSPYPPRIESANAGTS